MKPTEFIVENSIIAQEADAMHADHEVQMARSQMYSAAQAAIEIHRLLKDISEMQGIEGWVASKLTLASQYLESVRDYLKYEAVSKESEMMPFAEAAANYAIDKMLAEDEFKGWKDYAEKNPEKLNKGTRDLYARNTPRFGGDEGLPGAKSSRVDTGKGIATKIEKPEGVPKVSKKPVTSFKGGGGGASGHLADPSAVKSLIPNFESKKSKLKNKKFKEQTTTPPVGGLSKTTNPDGTTTTSYNQGPVSGTMTTRPDQSTVTTADYDMGPFGSVSSATGIGFGGAGKGVQQGGNQVSSITNAQGQTTNIAGRAPTQQDIKSAMYEKKKSNKLKEMASAGASGAGGIATSMSGPAGKPGTGKPKKIANAHTAKKITVGKGIY